MIKIEQATAVQANIVGELGYRLEHELWDDTRSLPDQAFFIAAAQKLLQPNSGFLAWLATNDMGDAVGLMTLNRRTALYAGGAFGEIVELYVAPEMRSSGLGKRLIETAVSFAHSQKWPFLEVGAPSLPRWQRTVDFYLRQGFRKIGPRLELEIGGNA